MSKLNFYHEHMRLRDKVEWEPLRSNLCLQEKIIGNLNLSSEELEVIAALRAAHRAKHCKEWRQAKRDENIHACRAHDRITRMHILQRTARRSTRSLPDFDTRILRPYVFLVKFVR